MKEKENVAEAVEEKQDRRHVYRIITVKMEIRMKTAHDTLIDAATESSDFNGIRNQLKGCLEMGFIDQPQLGDIYEIQTDGFVLIDERLND